MNCLNCGWELGSKGINQERYSKICMNCGHIYWWDKEGLRKWRGGWMDKRTYRVPEGCLPIVSEEEV